MEELEVVSKSKQTSHRDLLNILISANPEIKNINLLESDHFDGYNGLITFQVNTFNLGLTVGTFHKYKKLLTSQFIIKFLIDLFIRENINEFSKCLNIFSIDDMEKIMDESNLYRNCGINIENQTTTFKFHAGRLIEIISNYEEN